MAKITLKGGPATTTGELPAKGTAAPDFELVKTDLLEMSLKDLRGKQVVLNIFPSIDTRTCATSVRRFNQEASGIENTVVLCISKDLPFAQKRFCAAEGLENVIPLSQFRDNHTFSRAYGVEILEGRFKGLMARAVVVIDEKGIVKHTQLVGEISDEPDYEAALEVL